MNVFDAPGAGQLLAGLGGAIVFALGFVAAGRRLSNAGGGRRDGAHDSGLD